jgi:hypothetical protein
MTTFKETQKFDQPLIWIGIIAIGMIITFVFGVGLYKQLIQGLPFGNNPMSDNGLIFTFVLTTLLFIGLILLFAFARLSTIIDKNGIEYRFFPFQCQYRKISWNDIEKQEVITYKPIREYGGWGIRFGKKGKAFNVAGDKGLQLYLKNGKQILIGTQKDVDLADFLTTLK